MKTRIPLLTAALVLAATAFAQSIPNPTIPDSGKTPPGYVEFSTYKLERLIEGDALVTWHCWVHEVEHQGQKRKSRATPWLIAHIETRDGSPLDVDLHTIGAQHRSHVVLVRIVSGDPTAKIYRTEKGRVPVDRSAQVEATVSTSFGGKFYEIDYSDPLLGPDPEKPTFLNRYSLRSRHSKATIEVFFEKHPPGTFVRQIEDGGPPPIPPIGLEK